MRATGIVRRIDELGRIVVPKEIRKSYHVRVGDPLEIYTENDGEIILKKYSPIGELSSLAQEYADAVSKSIGRIVCISDRDQVIAVSGGFKKLLLGKKLHKDMERVMTKRMNIRKNRGEQGYVKIIDSEEFLVEQELIENIICEGNVIGTIGIFSKDVKREFSDMEKKTAEIAATFLGKQMEG